MVLQNSVHARLQNDAIIDGNCANLHWRNVVMKKMSACSESEGGHQYQQLFGLSLALPRQAITAATEQLINAKPRDNIHAKPRDNRCSMLSVAVYLRHAVPAWLPPSSDGVVHDVIRHQEECL